MGNFKVFIVEDDPWYGEVLKYHISMNPSYEVSLFKDGKECLDNLYKNPDVVCIDFGLPDIDGGKLMEKIKEINPNLPVIVISAQEQISVAVNLLKAGAKDYIVKDDHAKDMLWKSIINVRENVDLKQEIDTLKHEIIQKYDFEKSIIGKSDAIKKVYKYIEKAINSNINVSISGETGTGKELIAKAIHYNSDRSKKQFVAVNMAAIPSELLESELFGHEKGAFTGAVDRKIGKFEEADGGTIFLDEIGEMELSLQGKILRALQEREVVRLGGNKTIKFNARLITATHRDLREEIKKGTFREDLYFRIVGLPIMLPPLRDRGNDVLILANHFMDVYQKENGGEKLSLSQNAKEKLLSYNFLGNVRELKAVIDLACVMTNDNQISEDDITFHSIRDEGELITATERTLKEYNNYIIKHFLKKYDNNVLMVAKKLDIGKSTIYNLLKSGEVSI